MKAADIESKFWNSSDSEFMGLYRYWWLNASGRINREQDSQLFIHIHEDIIRVASQVLDEVL